MTVDPRIFHWMIPGERRIATWSVDRVQGVQGNSKDLVAGAYIVLAALWGSIGGVVILVGVILDVVSKSGTTGSTCLFAGMVPLVVAVIRVIQSRHARQLADP